MLQNHVEMASKVVEKALNYFKIAKNFGAVTAINRKSDLKEKMQWIGAYCDKKGIDKEQFMLV